MNRVLWCISKWSLFPSPNQKPQEIFLWYLLWEPGQTPEGKPHCFVEVSLRLSPPGDFNSWFCPHWTSATRQLLLRFLWWFFLKSICSVKLWLPVFPRLTLQSSGQAFVLCLTLVKGSITNVFQIFWAPQIELATAYFVLKSVFSSFFYYSTFFTLVCLCFSYTHYTVSFLRALTISYSCLAYPGK